MPKGKKRLASNYKGLADLSVRHDEYLAEDFALSEKGKLRKKMTEASQDPLFIKDLQDSMAAFEASKDPIVQKVRNAGKKLAKRVIESEGDIIILPSSNRPKAYNRLLKLAIRVLENKDQATLWLYEPQFGLDGKRPIDHMRTIQGAKDVESLLIRLEYGDCL